MWQETSGHEKVQRSLLNQKHCASIFRILGGAGWRQEEDYFCRIYPFGARLFQSNTSLKKKKNWYTDRTPRGVSGMKGMQWNCAEQEKLCAATACWVFASLVWKCFTSYSQGKKAWRGEGMVQHNGQTYSSAVKSPQMVKFNTIWYSN